MNKRQRLCFLGVWVPEVYCSESPNLWPGVPHPGHPIGLSLICRGDFSAIYHRIVVLCAIEILE